LAFLRVQNKKFWLEIRIYC